MRETRTREHHLFVMSVNLNLNLKGRAGDFHEMFLVFWSLNSLLLLKKNSLGNPFDQFTFFVGANCFLV